jgi:uncharacterized protein (DUF58 family)
LTFDLPTLSPTKDLQHPMLQGGISRWIWRTMIQRLTVGGRWFLLITFVFTGYAGASLQLQGFVPFAYAMGIWIVAVAAMLLYRPRVNLRAVHSPRICVGQTLPVEIEIEQLGGARTDLIVLPHRLPMPVDASPEEGVSLPRLRRREKHRTRLGLICRKRGSYTLHGYRVETDFPFALLRTRKIFAEEQKLTVYPHFHPLGRLTLPVGRRYQPGGVAMASNLGE